MNNLDDIKKDIEQNLNDDIKKSSKNLVFGKGNEKAKIMIIGEAPGAKEDETGIPFVGKAGKELDNLLKTINLSLDDVYIANILKYRPENNKNPTSKQIKDHTPYLIKQINAINPKIICTLGNFATKFALAGFDVEGMKKISGISTLHGTLKEIEYDSKKYFIFALYHPAAMIYNRNLRSDMLEDFISLKKYLELL